MPVHPSPAQSFFRIRAGGRERLGHARLARSHDAVVDRPFPGGGGAGERPLVHAFPGGNGGLRVDPRRRRGCPGDVPGRHDGVLSHRQILPAGVVPVRPLAELLGLALADHGTARDRVAVRVHHVRLPAIGAGIARLDHFILPGAFDGDRPRREFLHVERVDTYVGGGGGAVGLTVGQGALRFLEDVFGQPWPHPGFQGGLSGDLPDGGAGAFERDGVRQVHGLLNPRLGFADDGSQVFEQGAKGPGLRADFRPLGQSPAYPGDARLRGSGEQQEIPGVVGDVVLKPCGAVLLADVILPDGPVAGESVEALIVGLLNPVPLLGILQRPPHRMVVRRGGVYVPHLAAVGSDVPGPFALLGMHGGDRGVGQFQRRLGHGGGESQGVVHPGVAHQL